MALSSAVEARDPDMLLQFQKDHPADADDEGARQRIVQAQTLRDEILWERAVAGGPASLKTYLRDRTNPRRNEGLAKRTHDEQLMKLATKASGWDALERYPKSCLACNRTNKAAAVLIACERRREALKPSAGAGERAFAHSHAQEFVSRCKGVSDEQTRETALFVGQVRALMGSVSRNSVRADAVLTERHIIKYFNWSKGLTDGYGRAARELLQAQLARAIKPSVIESGELRSKGGVVKSKLRMGCTINVSANTGRALVKEFPSDLATCGSASGDKTCLKPGAVSAISKEQGCDLSIRDGKIALGATFFPLAIKAKAMGANGTQEFEFTLDKANMKAFTDSLVQQDAYSGRRRGSAGLNVRARFLDERQLKLSLSSFSSPISMALKWDKPKTPLTLMEKSLLKVVQQMNERYRKIAAGFKGAETRFELLDHEIVSQYQAMSQEMCSLAHKGYKPCSKTKSVVQALETLSNQKRIAEEKAAEARRREKAKWKDWARAYAWDVVKKKYGGDLIAGPEIDRQKNETDFLLQLSATSGHFYAAIRVVPGKKGSYYHCQIGGYVENPGGTRSSREWRDIIYMARMMFEAKFCD